MIPKGSQSIGDLVMRIAQDLIPRAPDAYTATDIGYLTLLLTMIGQDFDRVADVLVAEHQEASEILTRALSHLDEPGLKGRIEAALAATAPSLTVPDLNLRADQELAALIEVHTAVEAAMAAGAPWSEGLNAAIWRFLEGYAARRAYEVAM
jgi:hypothetical protein